MTKELLQAAEQTWLETDLISSMRQSALSARALALAEDMFDTADKRHQNVMEHLGAVRGELERRFFERAAGIGALEQATAEVLAVDGVVGLDG